jgi:hypothetical protein
MSIFILLDILCAYKFLDDITVLYVKSKSRNHSNMYVGIAGHHGILERELLVG